MASCVESTANGGVLSWEFYHLLERPGDFRLPCWILGQPGSSRCGFSSTAHFTCQDPPCLPGHPTVSIHQPPEFPSFRLGALGVPRDRTARGL
ncbi:hypothetical protein DUI87_10359 [Hirundo rustica rustica]|uniref:Uncharacterized protein n=1 Tax=Hirundo rustica rustica TaxID=333673 RepID=A0A3M0KNL1_HIRRU|nr:hypothetical protein DUI87_10359 [Hirundo rustica rustica]